MRELSEKEFDKLSYKEQIIELIYVTRSMTKIETPKPNPPSIGSGGFVETEY